MRTIAASLFLVLLLLSSAGAAGKQGDARGQAPQATNKVGNEAQNPEEQFNTANDKLGSAQEDVEAYRKAMEADPKHQAGRFQLGRLLVKQGNLAEARKLWEGRTSDEDNTYPNFIEVLERAENLQRAQKAIAETPHDPKALVQYGLAIMAGDAWVVDGRQEKALPYFKQALKLDPKNAEAHYSLGRCYVELADSPGSKDPAKLKREANNELAILKQLNGDLASKLEDYIKHPPEGFVASPLKPDK